MCRIDVILQQNSHAPSEGSTISSFELHKSLCHNPDENKKKKTRTIHTFETHQKRLYTKLWYTALVVNW